ncbi:MAG: septum site-determining protein MinC, partial [Thermomicrobiaceae bacterium]|nr:septum site-determining protein MinC [Thermomicrobiaceae bacterium]
MAERRPGGVGQVRVRGTQDGLVVQLPPDVPFPILLGQVRATIDGHAEFFRNGQVVIDYADRVPNVEEIVALRALLTERGVTLRTVTATAVAHRELLRSWGYPPLRLVRTEEEERRAEAPAPVEAERSALYLRRTLRSGASVSHEGDIVVL